MVVGGGRVKATLAKISINTRATRANTELASIILTIAILTRVKIDLVVVN